MKKNLCTLSICLVTILSLNAQGIVLNGKSFQTISKINLSSQADYIQLKQEGLKDAPLENYIKSGGKYHKTIFKAEELKNFINTGAISSLGAVSEKKMGKATINYLDKSTTIVVFYYTKKTLQVLEVETNEKDFFNESDGPVALDNEPGEGSELEKCYARCEVAFKYDGTYQERYLYFKCRIGCRKKYSQKNVSSVQEYSLSSKQPIK